MEVDAIVNAGKDLPFDLRKLLGGIWCLKAAQSLNCLWLPSAVQIQKVPVLEAQVMSVTEAHIKLDICSFSDFP